MNLGYLAIGCDFMATVTALSLRDGVIAVRATGRVSRGFPLGDIPVTLYGQDHSIISATHGSVADLLPGFIPVKGDTVEMNLLLKIASTSQLSAP